MRDKKDADYEVGFGRPPKHTQFQKGRSGNPKGRRRGSRNASTLLDEALNELVIVTENGRRKRVTKLDAIMKQLVNRAAQGDHRATQLLLANQIPRIEENEASLSAATERIPLAPPPSPEEKRMRNLAIAKILRQSGYIAQESTDMNGGAADAQELAEEPA
jgi:hypothetical protein